jgi:hypothetical protein
MRKGMVFSNPISSFDVLQVGNIERDEAEFLISIHQFAIAGSDEAFESIGLYQRDGGEKRDQSGCDCFHANLPFMQTFKFPLPVYRTQLNFRTTVVTAATAQRDPDSIGNAKNNAHGKDHQRGLPDYADQDVKAIAAEIAGCP